MTSAKVGSPVFGTFGIYRYILASMVAMAHLGPYNPSPIGIYAVFGFFILSGYVVSYILSNHYLHIEGGLNKYLINRSLRVFPLYWIVLVASIPLLLLFPDEAQRINMAFKMPHDVRDWIWNITSIGITDPLTGALSGNAIVFVSWSLGIELIYWTLIPKYVNNAAARKNFVRFSLAYTTFATSVTIWMHHMSSPLQMTNVFAASLPFCMGLCIYIRNEKNRHIPRWLGLFAMFAMVLQLMISPCFNDDPYAISFLLALCLNGLIISHLCRIDSRAIATWIQKLDKGLGNLSYPIYLVHAPAALLVHAAMPSLQIRSFQLWAVTLITSSLIAVALHYLIEMPIDRFRHSIK